MSEPEATRRKGGGWLSWAVLLGLLITALALFFTGVYKARIMVGRPVRSGLEMALIGTVSALAGYLIGLLLKAPPMTGLWQRIAPVTLGVYAIHPLWMWVLGELGINGFWVHPAVGIPLTATLAFILSVLSAALLARIPLLKRTVR